LYRIGRDVGIAMCLLLSVACRKLVEEPPCPWEVDPPNKGQVEIHANISLIIDMNWTGDAPYESFEVLQGAYDVRYIVEIYDLAKNGVEQEPANLLLRIERSSHDIITNGVYQFSDSMLVPAGKLMAVAWMDFVDTGTVADRYYDTDTLTHIKIIPQTHEYGYRPDKDALTGRLSFDMSPYDTRVHVPYDIVIQMIRPFAAYQIIATDYDKFAPPRRVALLPGPAVAIDAWYSLFFPQGYLTWKDAPDDHATGIAYEFAATALDNSETLIAADLVFVGTDTSYNLNMRLTTGETTLINVVSELRVPLTRNHVTIIRDEYFTPTTPPQDDGGVGVNDNFNGEDVINVKDEEENSQIRTK
jgi:hypothetical protein